jgi:phosphohistidine phosphatase
MKTLLLLRHAKATPPDDFVADHDRSLTPRGEEDAALMGTYLRIHGLIPDRVFCSTALRAHRTARIVTDEIGLEVEVERLRELYNAAFGSLCETIRRCAGPSKVALVVGHNPGLQALAVALAGSGEPDRLTALREKFPTAALAQLRFDVEDWSEVAPTLGVLERYVPPKDLKA